MNSERYPELAAYASKQGAPITAFLRDGWQAQPVYHYCSTNERQRLAIEFEQGRRWRYIDGLKPKYSSVKQCPKVWYHLDRAIAQARKTGAALILCNGGAGATAAFSRGLAATAINGGEAQIPADLLDELKRKYPEGEIWIVFDCDVKGRKAAPAVRAQLRLAGYTAHALNLGLPDKGGDIADFLKLYPPAQLANLPELPEPEQKPQHRISAQGDTETPAELINALATAYHAAPPNSKGWSRKNVVCPFHDDHDPSAGFSWQTGVLNCQVCGGISPKRSAEHFGIDWRAFYPKYSPMPARSSHKAGKLVFTGVKQPASDGPKSTAVITIVDKPAPRSWWTTAAIPHSHLAALLLTCDVAVTRLVQAMHAGLLAGAIVGEGFIMADVLAISPIDRRATYRAVEKLQTIGLVTKLGIEGEETTIPKNVTSYAICAPDALRWTLIQRGIYPALFKRYFAGSLPDTLPPALFGDDELPEDATLTPARLRQLAAAYGELATDADRATQSKFKSELRAWQAWLSDSKPLRFEVADNADKTTYRAAILRAVLANADPDAPHARRDLARLCGCSENTLDTLYKALNIIPVPQWELVPLQAGDSASIRAQYVKAQKSKRGKVMNIVIEDSTTTPDDFESIERAHLRGAPVYAQLRVASKLRPMTDAERQQASAQPVEAEPDRTVEPERTEDKPVITLFERWLRIALSRMGYSMNQHRDIIARNGDTAAYEVDTNALIDFVLNGRRLERTA